MRAGRLDRRVRLQRREIVRDQAGGTAESWPDIASVWAERRDVRGHERVQAGAEGAVADTVFRIRWRAGITPQVRVVDEHGLAFDIEGVAELGRRDGLELTCRRAGP